MSESVKKYIQEQFEKARGNHGHAVTPRTATISKYDAVIEVVQPIAEPVAPHHRPVCYSNHTVYEITTPKDESLEALYQRAIESLKY